MLGTQHHQRYPINVTNDEFVTQAPGHGVKATQTYLLGILHLFNYCPKWVSSFGSVD